MSRRTRTRWWDKIVQSLIIKRRRTEKPKRFFHLLISCHVTFTDMKRVHNIYLNSWHESGTRKDQKEPPYIMKHYSESMNFIHKHAWVPSWSWCYIKKNVLFCWRGRISGLCVFLFVCLALSRIAQNLTNPFPWNLVAGWIRVMGRPHRVHFTFANIERWGIWPWWKSALDNAIHW